MSKKVGNEDRRTFTQVVTHDLVNYIYFFLPLVIVHNAARYVCTDPYHDYLSTIGFM